MGLTELRACATMMIERSESLLSPPKVALKAEMLQLLQAE